MWAFRLPLLEGLNSEGCPATSIDTHSARSQDLNLRPLASRVHIVDI